MSNPTVEERLEWTIADNVKKAIEIADLREAAKTGVRCMEQRNEAFAEIERLEKLVDDIAYTAKNRKKRMHKYRDALRVIETWSQEVQDEAEHLGITACIMMWRGCIAVATVALKEKNGGQRNG